MTPAAADAIVVARESRHEVMVLDLHVATAEATIQKVREANAGTKIIIWTMHDDPELLRSLVAAGASGYLLESAESPERIAAINAASREQDNVLLSVSRATIIRLSQPAHAQSDLLSAREREALACSPKDTAIET
ncbi:MAG: hypothetical protein M3N95_00230 [Actinomycetota bacterium]|nr:hypothetical protein [Actinomycetota bacterium]